MKARRRSGPIRGDDAELGQSLIAETFERLMVIRDTPVIKVLPRRDSDQDRTPAAHRTPDRREPARPW